jgi:hypothetical protein
VATYYLATTGSDSGSGAIGDPWLTFHATGSKLSAGDTLTVRGGTYDEAQIGDTFPNGSDWTTGAVTISAYPGETVWVYPTSVPLNAVLLLQGKSFHIWDGISLRGDSMPPDTPNAQIDNSNHIRIKNSSNYRAACAGILVKQSIGQATAIELINLTVTNGDFNSSSTQPGHGIYFSSVLGNTTGANQANIIDSCRISGFTRSVNDAGVVIFGSPNTLGGFTVRNNVITGNYVGAFLGSATTVSNLFANNTVAGNTSHGVWILGDDTGTRVFNNTIHGNGGWGIQSGDFSNVRTTAITNNSISSNTNGPIRISTADAGNSAVISYNNFNGNGNGNAISDGNGLSTPTNATTVAPAYVNASTGDFSLQGSSGLIDAGVFVSGVPTDQVGTTRPQGAAFDIGAFEFSTFSSFRQNILDGLVSAQSETNGFNAKHSQISASAVTRVSNTVVTIFLPPLVGYDITVLEQLTETIPASALAGGVAIVATPVITILPSGAVTSTTGTAAGLATVIGVGRTLATSVGVAAGVAGVTAVSTASVPRGLSFPSSTATAVGRAAARSTGVAAGLAIVSGILNQTSGHIGTVAGSSTAAAVGLAAARGTGNAAGTSFATTTPKTLTSGTIEMEFNGVGNGWTAVTDWRRNPGIQWHRGFPGTGVLDLVADIGTLNMTLDNSEQNSIQTPGYYSPDNVNCRPGFGLNARVRYSLGGVVRFVGYIAAIDPVPGLKGPRYVNVEVESWMAVAARTRCAPNLQVQLNKRGDEIFQLLIDNMVPGTGPPVVERHGTLDVYPYTLDRLRDEQTLVRDEIYRVCTSGLDRCWERGDGTVVFESRAQRASVVASTDTFDDNSGFMPTRDRFGIVNSVQTTVHPRLPGTSYVVMYSLNAPITLTPGQPVSITGTWTDPENPNVRVGAIDLLPLVASVDYIVTGPSGDITPYVTVATSLSGNATTFTVTLGGSVTGQLTRLQQRGKPLYDYGPIVLTWANQASMLQNGVQQQSVDMAYQADQRFGLEAAQYIVSTASVLQTRVEGFRRVYGLSNTVELQRTVAREIGDRIAITDPLTGINRTFFINAISETEVEGLLTTEWSLAPADITTFWMLDVPGRGELDITARLAFGLIVGNP